MPTACFEPAQGAPVQARSNTPGRDGTRNAARRPGSGGRPRGCGFEEQGGGHVRVYIGGYIPYSHFVRLSVPSHSKLHF